MSASGRAGRVRVVTGGNLNARPRALTPQTCACRASPSPLSRGPSRPLSTQCPHYPCVPGTSAHPCDMSSVTEGSSRRLLAGLAPADARLDEAVDVAVEDALGVADLVVGAQVLDHLV